MQKSRSRNGYTLRCNVVKHPNRISNDPARLLPTCFDIPSSGSDLSVQNRLMMISTLKALNPVKNTEGAKTTGPKLTLFSLKAKCVLLLNLSGNVNARANTHCQTQASTFLTAWWCWELPFWFTAHSFVTGSSTFIMSGSSQHPIQSTTSTLATGEAVHDGTACPRFNPTHSASVSSRFVTWLHVQSRSVERHNPAHNKVVTRSSTSSPRWIYACVWGGGGVAKCVGWISRIAV